MDSPKQSPRTPWILLSLFSLLVAGILATGYFYYETQKRRITQQQQHELAAIADLKVGQISGWRHERLVDAEMIHHNLFEARAVDDFFRSSASRELREELLDWMATIQKVGGYDDVFLLDSKGKLRLALADNGESIGSYLEARMADIVRDQQVHLTDLHESEVTPRIHLDLVVPISRTEGGRTVPVGSLVLRINPTRNLYPLIQSWPTPSSTSETLILRREGDKVVFLSELRHRKDTALSFQLPVDTAHLPAAMAARGVEGLVEGIDYRGVPVLADIKKIPDTPWFMVAKVDKEEIFAPLREEALLVAVLGTVLIIAAGMGVGLWWRHQRALFYQAQYEAEVSRRMLAKHFEFLVRHANDIILLTELDGRIVEANDQASRSYGYAREEMLLMNISDLWPSGMPLEVEQRVTDLPEGDGILYETEHQRKDGTTFPTEVSLRQFPVDGKSFYQGIIRDITERKKYENRILHSNRLYAVLSQTNQAIVRLRDRNKLFQEICRIAVEYGKFRGAWVGVVEPDTQLLKPVASNGIEGEFIGSISMSLDDNQAARTPCTRVVKSGETVVVNDFENDTDSIVMREKALRYGYGSMAAAPIRLQGQVIGAFTVLSAEPAFFGKEETDLLDEIVLDISFALDTYEQERQRLLAEVALTQSEELHRTLVEQSSDGIYVLQGQRLVFVNRVWQHMFGVTESEAKADGFDYLGIVAPESRPLINERTEKRRQGIEVPSRYEMKGLAKNGTLLELEVTVAEIPWRGKPALQGIYRDITERKQSEKKLSAIYELSRDILVMHDERQIMKKTLETVQKVLQFETCTFFAVDDATDELVLMESLGGDATVEGLRLPLSEEKGITVHVVRTGELVNLGDVGSDSRYIETCFRGNSELAVPVKIKNKTIGVINAESSRRNAFTNDDALLLSELAAQVAVAIDNARLTRNLAESEEKYRRLFETAPIGIGISDVAGNVLAANHAMEEITGFSESELKAINVTTRYVDARERARLLTALRKSGFVRDWETMLKRKDGRVYHALLNIDEVEMGGRKVLHTIQRDVTERKWAEEELKRSKEWFGAIFEASRDGIIVEENETIVFINTAYSRLLNYNSPEELAGKHISVLQSDSDNERMLDFARRRSRGEAAPTLYEFKGKKKDGSLIDLEASVSVATIAGTFHIISVIRDISERKLAEEASKRADEMLRQSEERFRLLAESSLTGIYLIQDQSFAYVNHALASIFGYEVEEIIGKLGPLDLTCPDDRPRVVDYIRRRVAGEVEDIRYDFLGLRKDGTVICLEAHGRRIPYAGKIGIIGTLVDITVRKRAEDALRESEARYRELVETAPDIIYSLAEDGSISSLNPAFEKMSGWSVADWLNKPFLPLVHPDDVPRAAETFQKAVSGEILPPYELRIRSKSGEYLIGEFISSPLVEKGKIVGEFGIARDVTERKRAERENALLAQTLRSAKDCISVTDQDNTILFVNDAFLDTYGFIEDELVGKNISIVKSASVSSEHYQEVLPGTLQGGWHGELVNKRKNGTDFPVEIWTSVVRDGTGTPVALVGIARDITERKQLEQELVQAQKLKSLGTLAGGIAHDFNNILGIVLGLSSMLERHRADPEKFRESVGAIDRAVQRGAALVRQILTFARKTDVSFEPLSVSDLLHEILSMLRQTFPKIITFTEHIENDLPYITADHSQMHQALLNLCVNARDAMPQGGSITIGAAIVAGEKLKERFPSARQDRYVCVSVSDTGIGIDEAVRRQIFDPFFTTKEKGKGTGLGLSVVYGVIQDHQGFIDLESEKGRGTTFYLYLPVPEVPEAPRESEQQPSRRVLTGTETILVVEDEEPLLDMVRLVLVSNGYAVHEAKDGVEAIELYARHRDTIALVMTDMGLPRMTGMEEFIKLKELNPDVKVILASGFVDPEVKAKLLKGGAKGFVSKPYVPEQILMKIRDVLDAK